MALLQGKRPRNIKFSNHKAVFSVLREHENMSVGEISREVHLSNTAVSRILSVLQERGMVLPTGKGESSTEGGKPPVLFSVSRNYKYAMVLIADVVNCDCYVYDVQYKVQSHIKYAYGNCLYSEFVEKCACAMQEAVREARISPEQLYGCCIAAPGIIDSVNGEIMYPVWRPEWGKNLPFCRDLKRSLPFEIDLILENNSRLGSFVEFDGLEEERRRGICVGLFGPDDLHNVPGVGGFIRDNRAIRRGMNGYAGEFGHLTVDYQNEEMCICGRRGCLQTLTSPERMLSYARERREKYPDSILWKLQQHRSLVVKDIFEASNRGDMLAMEVVDIAAKYYSRVIETIILTVDPETIIIGGCFSTAGDYFLNRLNAQLHHANLFGFVSNLQIQYARYARAEALPFGAAKYLFDLYFNMDETFDEKTAN